MLTNGLVPFCVKKWSIWGRIPRGEKGPVAPIWPRARKVTSILVPQFPGYLVTWLPDTGYLVLFLYFKVKMSNKSQGASDLETQISCYFQARKRNLISMLVP